MNCKLALQVRADLKKASNAQAVLKLLLLEIIARALTHLFQFLSNTFYSAAFVCAAFSFLQEQDLKSRGAIKRTK